MGDPSRTVHTDIIGIRPVRYRRTEHRPVSAAFIKHTTSHDESSRSKRTETEPSRRRRKQRRTRSRKQRVIVLREKNKSTRLVYTLLHARGNDVNGIKFGAGPKLV